VPRVEWDAVGARVFEAGVNRGMLYVGSDPGVAWNGLTKVSEVPVGGTAKEVYRDGDKIINLVSLEEYSATIEAFSAPKAFDPCSGILNLAPGLFACEQPRKKFGFSYRTLIGDDVRGLYGAYLIHLVYNVTAKSPEFLNETRSDRPNVRPRTWSITTEPLYGVWPKPTSHFMIDTREYAPADIQVVEDTLYGTSTTDPRMLTATELGLLVEVEIGSGV
jgi:hypothetical protein